MSGSRSRRMTGSGSSRSRLTREVREVRFTSSRLPSGRSIPSRSTGPRMRSAVFIPWATICRARRTPSRLSRDLSDYGLTTRDVRSAASRPVPGTSRDVANAERAVAAHRVLRGTASAARCTARRRQDRRSVLHLSGVSVHDRADSTGSGQVSRGTDSPTPRPFR